MSLKLLAGVRPQSKVAACWGQALLTGVRPQSKVAGDCTLAPDPGAARQAARKRRERGAGFAWGGAGPLLCFLWGKEKSWVCFADWKIMITFAPQIRSDDRY